jgi:signal transduction histidine kinase
MRALRAWLRLLLLLLLAGMAPAAARADAATEIAEPAGAARLRSNEVLPPADDLPWEAIRLPDNRRPALIRAEEVAVWYRIEFDAALADRAGASWAVYVPHLRDGGRFFLNGRAIEQIAESDNAIRVKWERPQLVQLPDNLLNETGNVLMVRTQPRLGIGFPQLSFGRSVDLQPLQERRLFWVLTMPQITIIFCALVSLFTLIIWAVRREEQLYGLFGFAVLLWGLRTLTFVIETLPVDHWWSWRMVYHASTGGFVAVMTVFCARFAQISPGPRVWSALFIYWLLCPVSMLIFGDAADSWINKVWVAGFIPIGLATAGMIVFAASRQRTATAYALLVGLTLTVLAGIHDYLLLVGWLGTILPAWDGHRVFLLHYGANLMLLIMGGILAQRFIQVLFDLESLNRNLEQRVADRETKLEFQFHRAHALERERATVEERRRIMEDMHDGLGSQLFQSLSRAERGDLAPPEMAHSLRSCIDEMRLALEALGTPDDSFLDAIADFRFRWERQFDAAGVRSHWRIEATDETLKFPPRTTLQFLRIIQEALTNILKHARASEVRVSIAGRDDAMHIQIEDDGVGMADNAGGPGHGLRNMRRRAFTLGAELDIDSAQGCTRVAIRAPLAAAMA